MRDCFEQTTMFFGLMTEDSGGEVIVREIEERGERFELRASVGDSYDCSGRYRPTFCYNSHAS